jgi:hypothetical protein
MPRSLNTADAGFEEDFRALLGAKREVSVERSWPKCDRAATRQSSNTRNVSTG